MRYGAVLFVKIKQMNKASSLLPLVFIILMTSPSSAQKKKPATMTGSAAKGAVSSGLQVAPDLALRLAKYRRVEMPFHSAGLSDHEKKLVEKLVDASRNLENIYWRQIDPEALTLYLSLATSKSPKDQQLRHYVVD